MTRIKMNHKYLELGKDDDCNLQRGGNCNVFDLIDELKIAFKDDKEI